MAEESERMARGFLPGPRITNLIVALAVGALGWAAYMRYAVLEQSSVGLACEAGLATGTCAVRRVVQFLHNNSIFGIAALVLATIQLIRPTTIVFTLALIATALGVVLYNANTAGLAGGLLILSFARPYRSSATG